MDLSQSRNAQFQVTEQSGEAMEQSPPRHWVPRHHRSPSPNALLDEVDVGLQRRSSSSDEVLMPAQGPAPAVEEEEPAQQRQTPRTRTCAVPGCQPTADRKRHSIPKEATMREAWIDVCGLADVRLPAQPRICEVHFKPEDYRRGGKTLRTGTVPSLNLPTPVLVFDLEDSPRDVAASDGEEAADVSAGGDVVPADDGDAPGDAAPTDDATSISAAPPDDAAVGGVALRDGTAGGQAAAADEDIWIPEMDPRDAEIERLRRESQEKDAVIESLQKKAADRDDLLKGVRKKVHSLRTQLAQSKATRKILKKNPNKAAVRREIMRMNRTKAEKMFFLGKTKRPANWTQDEIVQALVLRSLSKRAYKYLRKMKMMALPGISTLRRWIREFRIKPGLLEHSLEVLGKSRLTQTSRIYPLVCLSFDEMTCDQDLSYDAREDYVPPSAKKFHVAQVRGICHNFKQPVWCGFDQDMTPTILDEIIMAVEKQGFKVLANVSDLATTNQGLWRDKGISVKNTSFVNPFDRSRKVHVFADVPHMLKLLRNHFLDRGFILPSGAQFVREDLEEIKDNVDPIENELRLHRKLTDVHFECKGSTRQKVSLAAELFSNTSAELLEAAHPEKKEQAEFVKLVNNFFDVMNSRIPEDKKKPLKSGYGSGDLLEQQSQILDKMQDMMTNMRQIGKKEGAPLIPFQKGIIWSIKSAKNLFKELQDEYNVSYLLTSHVNQDGLENAFSQIRAMGATHTNPHPTECMNRLRLLLIGSKGLSHLIVESAAVRAEKLAQGAQEEIHDTSVLLSGAICSDEDLHATSGDDGNDEEWQDIDQDVDAEEIQSANEERESAPTQNLDDDDDDEDSGDLPDPDEVQPASHTTSSAAPRLTPAESSEEALKMVTGWLAYACRKKHPDLGTPTAQMPLQQLMDDFPWLSRISRGGLRAPKLWFLEMVRAWEVQFDEFQGGKLKMSHVPGIIKNFSKRLRRLHPDSDLDDVIKKYSTFRVHVRIKYLNKLRRDAAKEKRDAKREARKRREHL